MDGFYLMPHPPLLIPEVGKGEEKRIADTERACRDVGAEIARKGVETIILVSPHGLLFQDAVTIVDEAVIRGSMARFGAPEVTAEYPIDRQITQAVLSSAEKEGIPIIPLNRHTAQGFGKAVTLDHGALVPLYFAAGGRDVSLVHLTYGLISGMELYRLGMLIREAADASGRRTAFIASGDLSHRLTEDGPYPYSPRGAEFDTMLTSILESGDFAKLFDIDDELLEEAGQCGLRSILMLCGALDGCRSTCRRLSYEGPFGVGYAVMSFEEKKAEPYSLYEAMAGDRKLRREELREQGLRTASGGGLYTSLARKALEYYFANHSFPVVPQHGYEELTTKRGGVFVCLKSKGRLRGCIGTLAPVRDNVGEEIISNAVSAALRDPRFPPVRAQELDELDITVDVLSASEDARREDLDPAVYGVIVSSGAKMGVLLPDLAGIDTVDKQLDAVLDKAGIDCDEPYGIQRFTVTRYAERGEDR